MLQTESIASLIPWNDVLYSNWCPIFTIILLILRIIIVILQRKLYARPIIISLFLTIKLVMDYLMFEGVERFSWFSEHVNLQILSAIEIFYVIMSNFMIYSVFYGDFALPLKVIIQFSALNLVSVIVAMVLLIVIENVLCYMTTVIALHAISLLLYRDKSSALLKCGIYNAIGKSMIYMSIILKVVFDHFLRIFYISNLLLNFVAPSPSRDIFLYLSQATFTCILLFAFIFYRRQNSDNIGPVFAAEKKIGGKTKTVRTIDSNFVFENAAEELMFPAENEMNTISDITSEDLGYMQDLDDELEAQKPEPEIVSVNIMSSREPSIFTTNESGRPRRHEHRNQIMIRTLSKVTSIDCYHPSSIE